MSTHRELIEQEAHAADCFQLKYPHALCDCHLYRAERAIAKLQQKAKDARVQALQEVHKAALNVSTIKYRHAKDGVKQRIATATEIKEGICIAITHMIEEASR